MSLIADCSGPLVSVGHIVDQQDPMQRLGAAYYLGNAHSLHWNALRLDVHLLARWALENRCRMDGAVDHRTAAGCLKVAYFYHR